MTPRVLFALLTLALAGCGGGSGDSAGTTLSNPASYTMPAGGVSAVPPNTN